jgi:hypothetical protein
LINGKHGQGTHSTKMGADKLTENTPNAPKFICPNCLFKPKSLGFRWKTASLDVCSPWTTLWKNHYYKKSSAHGEKKKWTFLTHTLKLCTASARINKYYISLAHTIRSHGMNVLKYEKELRKLKL